MGEIYNTEMPERVRLDKEFFIYPLGFKFGYVMTRLWMNDKCSFSKVYEHFSEQGLFDKLESEAAKVSVKTRIYHENMLKPSWNIFY